MTKSWKDYPTSFLAIVDRFERDKSPLVVELPQVGQLRARRRLFYLFFKAVGDAVNNGDRDALRAYHITRNLTIGVSPARGEYSFPGKMTITYDPFAAALELDSTNQNSLLTETKPEKEKSHEPVGQFPAPPVYPGRHRIAEPKPSRSSDIIDPAAIQEALRRKRERESEG